MNEELKVVITADNQKLKQSLRESQSATKDYENQTVSTREKVKDAFNQIGAAAKTMAQAVATGVAAIAAGATAAAATIGKAVSATVTYGDSIDKMSQKMGMSAQAYQEWDYILKRSGSSISEMQSAMRTLANAAETNNDAFARLGITQEELRQLNQEQLFERTITALQKVGDSTTRTYLASQLLGKGSTELGALLNESSNYIANMREEVHELGGVMSDDAIAQSAKFSDSLLNIKTAASGLKNSLVSELLPSLNMIVEGIGGVFKGDAAGAMHIEAGVNELVNALEQLMPRVFDIGGKIFGVLGQSLVSNLPTLLKGVVKIVRDVAGMLLDNLPIIVGALVDIISNIVEALPDFVSIIANALPGTIDILIGGAVGIITSICANMEKIIEPLIDAMPEIIASIVYAAITNLPLLLQGINELIGGLMRQLPKLLSPMGDEFSDVWLDILKQGIVNGTIAAINALITIITEGINGLIGMINSFFHIEVPSWVPGVGGKSFGVNIPSIPTAKLQVPFLAQGGIVNRPTLNVAGEAGAEAIVPLERNTEWMDSLVDKLAAKLNAPVVMQIDGKTFAQLTCNQINKLTRQSGVMPLTL